MLSNEEVVEIVASAPARSSAAQVLVETAVRAWRTKYPTSKVDDCAVVCFFLDSHSNNISSASNGVNNEKVKEHSTTVRNGEDVLGQETEEALEESNEETSEQEEGWKDWSALQGVSRADTLLTLPRFEPEKREDKTTGGTTKPKTNTG